MTAGDDIRLLEVVICTYNNAAMLDTVLGALARQTGEAAARWSCVVVDNNCTDGTTAVVAKYVAQGTIAGLRTVVESEQGLTPARLRGVRSTAAPWVAFVDDDCVLEPDWISNALAFAENARNVGAFGGRVIVEFEEEPARYVRTYAYAFAQQEHGLSQKAVPFLVGAGLVVSRAALMQSGWTAAPLLADRVGAQLVSGGDVEIVLRVAATGCELWYVPQCALHHRIPARRTSLHYLIDINRELGVSQALADALVWQGSSAAWFSASLRSFVKQSASVGQLALSVVRRRAAAAEIFIQLSFRRGQLQGLARIAGMSRHQRNGLIGRARPVERSRASL